MTHRRTILPLIALVIAGCAAQATRAPEAPASQAPAATEAAPQRALDAEGPPGAAAGAPAAARAPASEPSMPATTKGESTPGAQEDELELLTRKIDGALALSTPNCTTAWSLRDRICDLAQRLCDLAARSAEPEMAERCTDGRDRCERATARVRAGCAD